MSDATIRPARPSDVDAVAALWQSFLEEQTVVEQRVAMADDAVDRWRNDFPLWLQDSTRKFLVAEIDGTIAGFAHAHRWGPPPILAESAEVYIDDVYVAADFRGDGHGAALVDALRTWAESLNADRLRLGVLAENTTGRTFWEAQGAQPLALTYTIELDVSKASEDSPRSKRRIGF
ncbi:MAG: GNAT family N-acetyltransferase [Bacteroidetes bacterium]|jgi:GNAT superfamily N-acetyltransferase|nr:GNAT family N-acetyltransferase [Bacteroidota bacterium]